MNAGESRSEGATNGSGWGEVLTYLLRFVVISILVVVANVTLIQTVDVTLRPWSWGFFGLSAALGFGLEFAFAAAVDRFWPKANFDRVATALIMAVLVSGIGAAAAFYLLLSIALLLAI